MPDAVHFQIADLLLTYVKSLITGGDIAGIATTNCQLVHVPHFDKSIMNVANAGIIIAVGPSEEFNEEESTNIEDAISYPVLIATVDPANQDQALRFDERKVWRETLLAKINHNQGIFSSLAFTGFSGLDDVIVETSEVIDAEAWFDENVYLTEITTNVSLMKERRA